MSRIAMTLDWTRQPGHPMGVVAVPLTLRVLPTFSVFWLAFLYSTYPLLTASVVVDLVVSKLDPSGRKETSTASTGHAAGRFRCPSRA